MKANNKVLAKLTAYMWAVDEIATCNGEDFLKSVVDCDEEFLYYKDKKQYYRMDAEGNTSVIANYKKDRRLAGKYSKLCEKYEHCYQIEKAGNCSWKDKKHTLRVIAKMNLVSAKRDYLNK